jgi:hypothetical protein
MSIRPSKSSSRKVNHARRSQDLANRTVYTSERVSASSLARRLDVDVDTVRSIAGGYDGTLVLQSGSREVITKAERDEIFEELKASILNGVVSKIEFVRRHDLSHYSMEKLVSLSEIETVEVDGYLYSTSYGMAVSDAIDTSLRDHIQKMQ